MPDPADGFQLMRVLQVDDDPKTTEIVEAMLRSEGHSCQSTESGKHALELTKRKHYDVILLDIMLPDIDGFEILRRLRMAGDRTPVVIQSGLIDRTASARGSDFGVTDYLLKPFNKGELMERLRSAISLGTTPIPAGTADKDIPPDSARIRKHERRDEKRLRSLKSARIAYGSGLDCLVHNLSHAGAEIQLPSLGLDCPKDFALRFRSGLVYRCEVCWRAGDRLGVKFVPRKRGAPAHPSKVTAKLN